MGKWNYDSRWSQYRKMCKMYDYLDYEGTNREMVTVYHDQANTSLNVWQQIYFGFTAFSI